MIRLDPIRRQALFELLRHAATHSAYYADQSWAQRMRRGEQVRFRDLPVTPKEAVKANAAAFHCADVPPAHGTIVDKWTSGSTGEPTHVRKTLLHFRMNVVENRRLRQGWEKAPAALRVMVKSPTAAHPAGSLDQVGDLVSSQDYSLYSSNPRQIADVVLERQVTHLGPLFANMAELVLDLLPPLDHLKLVSTTGEVSSQGLIEAIGRQPNCRHFDSYGTVETGLIASKCASCGNFHLADRHMLIEVLDDEGRPTPEGGMGRVVATPLFNFAMPLLRYEIGDYVVPVSTPDCSFAPRGFSRIVGRQRSFFLLPDGTRVVPHIPVVAVKQMGIRRFKLIQHSHEDVEFRYVMQQPGTGISCEAIQNIVDVNMSPLFRVRCEEVDDIASEASGKYLMHECRLNG